MPIIIAMFRLHLTVGFSCICCPHVVPNIVTLDRRGMVSSSVFDRNMRHDYRLRHQCSWQEGEVIKKFKCHYVLT